MCRIVLARFAGSALDLATNVPLDRILDVTICRRLMLSTVPFATLISPEIGSNPLNIKGGEGLNTWQYAIAGTC